MAADTRIRNNKRLRFSLLVAALIGLLLWYTEWPAIRPGLIILLVGQLALASFLVICNRRLTADADVDEWFGREMSALRYLSWLENGPRLLGFALLAFGFWRSTGNLPISLAVGLVYPAVIYWGVTRVSNRQVRRQLQAEWQLAKRTSGRI